MVFIARVQKCAQRRARFADAILDALVAVLQERGKMACRRPFEGVAIAIDAHQERGGYLKGAEADDKTMHHSE
jgi:hypothetical protein